MNLGSNSLKKINFLGIQKFLTGQMLTFDFNELTLRILISWVPGFMRNGLVSK